MAALEDCLRPRRPARTRQIWEWNAHRHGATHADAYIAFLRTGIARLADEPDAAKPVDSFPELRRLTLRRRAGGDGHIAVVQFDAETIGVLHIYHTRQDVFGRLRDERGG